MESKKLIRIAINDEKYTKEACSLAERIINMYDAKEGESVIVDIIDDAEDLALEKDEILTMKYDIDGLTLIKGKLSLKPDFQSLIPRLKRSNLDREYLVKAARIKGVRPELLTIIDATAGLGEDSMILAAAGYRIEMYEHDPVIAALLRDKLRRAAFVPELASITARMHLHEEDSISALRNGTAPETLRAPGALQHGTAPETLRAPGALQHGTAPETLRAPGALQHGTAPETLRAPGALQHGTAPETLRAPGALQNRRPDIILLDPMFPERQKSASVKKKFQLLHLLESPCSDEESLLDAAFFAAPRKIIIKRPPKGPFLALRRPDYSISGKAVRYDCFVNLTNKFDIGNQQGSHL